MLGVPCASLSDAARWLFTGSHGWGELDVRANTFPKLAPLLRLSPPDIAAIKGIVADDQGVFGGFGGSRARFAAFFKHSEAPALLTALLGDPQAPPTTEAIDIFIERAGVIAIHDPKGKLQIPESALFTSALLTAAFPDRFVDFRNNRWRDFAALYFLGAMRDNGTYAERLFDAAEIARAFVATPAFQEHILPAAQAHRPEAQPLWVVAALTFHIADSHPAVPYLQAARKDFSAQDAVRELRERLAVRRSGLGGS